MQNLVCVSKKMHLVFNDLYITHRFLKACTREYGTEVEEIAPRLKTMGAYLFLRQYIYANHLDKVYEVAQQLYPLISQICRETEHLFQVKEGTLSVGSYDGPRCFFVGNIQIVQGLILYVNRKNVKLAHPFGVIIIYNKCWRDPQLSELIFLVATVLIDVLHADFHGFLSDFGGNLDGQLSTLHQVIPVKPPGRVPHTKIEIIDPELFNEKEVGQNLILSTGEFQHTLYACRRAFETVLPQPRMLKSPITSDRYRLIKTLTWILANKGELNLGLPKKSSTIHG